MKTKLIAFITVLLLPIINRAQVMNAEPQMADTFRSEGKIYVVIAVLAIIFTCIVTYLILIDIKLKKLEKKNN